MADPQKPKDSLNHIADMRLRAVDLFRSITEGATDNPREAFEIVRMYLEEAGYRNQYSLLSDDLLLLSDPQAFRYIDCYLIPYSCLRTAMRLHHELMDQKGEIFSAKGRIKRQQVENSYNAAGLGPHLDYYSGLGSLLEALEQHRDLANMAGRISEREFGDRTQAIEERYARCGLCEKPTSYPELGEILNNFLIPPDPELDELLTQDDIDEMERQPGSRERSVRWADFVRDRHYTRVGDIQNRYTCSCDIRMRDTGDVVIDRKWNYGLIRQNLQEALRDGGLRGVTVTTGYDQDSQSSVITVTAAASERSILESVIEEIPRWPESDVEISYRRTYTESISLRAEEISGTRPQAELEELKNGLSAILEGRHIEQAIINHTLASNGGSYTITATVDEGNEIGLREAMMEFQTTLQGRGGVQGRA